MSWPKKVRDKIDRLKYIEPTLNNNFVGRERAIKLLTLAALCQEHLLLIGPPGTAKTEIINQFTQLIDAQSFHYLLTRFTEPSELFGPLDLKAFQNGKYEIRTEGMLPKAHVVFLDEIFQGSSAILNSLLTLLNERTFNNGPVREKIPLITLIGASNLIPDDPWLKAFADRFVLRLEVNELESSQLTELLECGWANEKRKIKNATDKGQGSEQEQLSSRIKLEDLEDLHSRLLDVKLSNIREPYASLIRELRLEGIEVSDRRVVKGLKLIAGAALLRRDNVAQPQDFWPIFHLWNRPEEAEVIRNVLQPKLADAGVEMLDSKRPVEEVKRELEVLQHQIALLSSQSGIVRHLEELNKLRREVTNDHSDDKELLEEINSIIYELLQNLNYVQS